MKKLILAETNLFDEDEGVDATITLYQVIDHGEVYWLVKTPYEGETKIKVKSLSQVVEMYTQKIYEGLAYGD